MRRASRSAGASSSPTSRSRTSPRNDPVSAKIITDEFAHWDDIDVHIRGETITSGGHGFIGIGRKRMLEILQDRARELGVALHFDAECDPADPKWRDYDLVIASDGANSRFRDAEPEAFGVDVDVRANKFVWLGTSKVFDAFTFAFEQTEHGWIWAHAYRFAPDCSTFIVECSEADLAQLRLRPDGAGRQHRRLRKAVRQISRRPSAGIERVASASARPPG